jgi:simple sugar transport system ATP-binding protein
MVREGHSLVFISHKLQEVMAISDRVTVLRNGKVIATRLTRDVTRAELVRMMVGREIGELEPRPAEPGPVRLSVQGLHAMGDRGSEALRGVELEVHAGEIVGLAGVSGNGQRELAECLAGMRRASAGKVMIGSREITTATLNARIDAGMACIPEERMRDGAIREFSVQENIFLHDHSSPRFRRGIFLSFRRMEKHAARLVEEFAVKTPGLDTPLKNLSGGNIQKLIMARELSRRPEILIAAQPTRGVDVSSTGYIHEQLLQQRETGTGILLISEDLDEVCTLSDRIAVMYEGRIIGIVNRGQATRAQLGLMMAGVSQEEALRA